MKHRNCRFLARFNLLSLVAVTVMLALPLQAQDAGDKRAPEARATSAAYTPGSNTPESSRPESKASANREKRKPRWFDERRQQAAEPAADTRFERLSYTRYEGEADQGSGICVYYQSSYTYSCR